MLSLKLSEAVSKALTPQNGPVPAAEQVAGKRPIPPGRGYAFGALVASELKAAAGNQHLYRAIIRSLHRPLSVLLSNLSSQLLPLISSPAFLSPPAPTLQVPHSNATQLHALGIATFAGELLETFDEFSLGNDHIEMRGDGLKQIREGLVSLVHRVVNPLTVAIKQELLTLVEALEIPGSAKPLPSNGKAIGIPLLHPSVISLQSIIPIYARALTRYASTPTSQTILASLLISVIWRAMVALSHRPYTLPVLPLSGALATATKRLKSSPSSTPPATPPASRFTIKLPSPSSRPPSRPPSPPNSAASSVATDARVLYELFNQLPRPSLEKASTRLAREAVEEAFHGLEALPSFFDLVPTLPNRVTSDETVLQQLESVTAELPTLIALPVLLQISGLSSVSSFVGLSEDEYRNGCLAGFGRADECAAVVGHRVRDNLGIDTQLGFIIAKWLDGEIQAAD